MSADDGSLTPPLSPMFPDSEDFLDSFPCDVSPTKEQRDAESPFLENEDASLPLFNCSTYSRNTNKQTELLNSLLEQCGTTPERSLDPCLEIFGAIFVVSLEGENLDQLLLFLSEWIGKFDILPPDVLATVVTRGSHLREEIAKCLEFFKTWIHMKCLRGGSMDTQLQRGLTLLHNTLLRLDDLSEIPYHNYSAITSREYHKFHLTLDIYWKLLETLHTAEAIHPGISSAVKVSRNWEDHDYGEDKSMFLQVVDLVLWQLVTLSHKVFQNVSMKESLTTSPFLCPCIQEMWRRVICSLNHHNTKHSGESFWLHIHSILQTLLDDTPKDDNMEMESTEFLYPPEALCTKDNAAFCLWLLMHISPLCMDKTKNVKISMKSIYQDVSKILKKCLSQNEVGELDLRCYLHICLKLLHSWGPDINIVVILWDYFYRRLNNSFQLNNSSVDGIAPLSKTAGALWETCTRLSSGSYVQASNDTSFYMFVGLLCNSLKVLINDGSSQEWKQMKGRIYSKFHLRRVQEMRETGLHNFCCLFISLALTADLEDVSSKMCEYCEMVEGGSTGVGKKLMAWRGMFAIAIEFVQRKLDISFIAEKLIADFSKICLDFSQDTGHRYNNWQLVTLYLDSVQEIYDRSSDLSSSQHILIGEGFQPLLSACRNNESQMVLSVLQEVLAKVRFFIENSLSIEEGKDRVVYSSLYSTLYTPLRDLACSLTAPVEVADCLAALSLLGIHFNQSDFVSVVKFCLSDSINKGVMCRYLSQVMSVSGVVPRLSANIPNYQTLLVQAWVRCSIFVPSASVHLRCMLELEEVRSVFQLAGTEIPSVSNERAIYHFFKAISAAYGNTQGWKERIELRDRVMQYFCDIHRQIAPVLQSLHPVETLNNVYAVVGYIVKCCAPMIFVESKPDCPLPHIINSMIVPHIMLSTDKPVSPVLLNVIREHLHQFVIGLSKLDYRKAPYLQRRLGDIVAIYLPKFWSTASSHDTGLASAVHPLVASLRDSFTRESPDSAVSFRHFILELVRDKFLMGSPLLLPANHQHALLYLKEIVKRTTRKELIAQDCKVLLYGAMKAHMLTEVMSVQNIAQFLINQYTDSIQQCGEHDDRGSLKTTLNKFVTDYKKTHLDSVIKTLEKIPPTCAGIIQGISKQIQHYIVEHEANRGVGTDSKLRTSYIRLVRHFGIETGDN